MKSPVKKITIITVLAMMLLQDVLSGRFILFYKESDVIYNNELTRRWIDSDSSTVRQ